MENSRNSALASMANQSKSANNTGRRKSTGPDRGYQLALMTNAAGLINPEFLGPGVQLFAHNQHQGEYRGTYRDPDKEIDKYSARDSCDSRKKTDAVARHQVVSVGAEIFKTCCLFRRSAALIAPFGCALPAFRIFRAIGKVMWSRSAGVPLARCSSIQASPPPPQR